MTRRVSRPPRLRVDDESQVALDQLRAQGLTPPDRPDGDVPQLPKRLTELSDEELMERFAELTAWTDFLSTQVAIAQVDERMYDRDLELFEAKSLLANWGNGSNDRVTIAKAGRLVDPAAIAKRERRDEAHAYRKLVEVLANNVERDAALVSRELTRRTSSAPVNRRAERYRP